jgi:uncharacterized surface protein with fasciclin (FAS1) repeats
LKRNFFSLILLYYSI